MILDINYKKIYDNIHGFIKMSNWAMEIINTKYFQRLKYLHQLGTCYYVFPNATHSRFEHSIGTYHLVGWILESIKKSTDQKYINKLLSEIPELNEYLNSKTDDNYLDNVICELVKIAGLCHDIGHGPFSHVFDDVFIEALCENKNKKDTDTHENRSCLLVEKIIKTTRLKNIITDQQIQFIKHLINPPYDRNGFIYQIVSNNLNSIDVDKCDYIARDTYAVGLKFSFDFRTIVDDVIVINNIISYPKQLYYEISCLFMTRYRLHKQIYSHKSVIATQFMINDIMLLINPILEIYESTNDMDKFCELTDSYVLESVKILAKTKEKYNIDEQARIEKANDIMNRLTEYNFYKFIGTIVTKIPIIITINDIITFDNTINPESILVYNGKIGFVSGKKDNPLDSIYFFDKKVYKMDNNNHSIIKKERISAFLPDTYQENLIMIFVKDNNDIDTINKIRSIYLLLLEKIETLEYH